MAISAFKGPVVSYGSEPLIDGNEFEGPDVHNAGSALQDPRAYTTYAGGDFVCGWFQSGRGYLTIDAIPASQNATCLGAATTQTGNVTLASANNSSAGVVVSASAVNINTGALVTGYVAMNCPNATATSPFLAMGQSGVNGRTGVNVWDPNACYGRTVLLTSAGTDSGKTATISGADCFGVPMTQTVNLANTSAVATTKAFKYISSVNVPTAGAATGISIGQGTVFGLGLRADSLNYVQAFHLSSSATAITAADTNSATATTGDVRGTVIVGNGGGTSRLTVYQALPAAAILQLTTGTTSGVIGVAQA